VPLVLLAVGLALIVVASAVAFESARAFVDTTTRIEALAHRDVHGDVSSTTTAVPRGREVTPLRERDAALDGLRASAARQRLRTGQAVSLLGVLALACIAAVVALLRDARRTEDSLRREIAGLSTHDALTGLPNGRFFTEWLTYAIAHARRGHGHVGVLFVDINGCAAVTDLHGAAAAASLLVEVACRFRGAAREGDLFARLGETEFALATPNARDGRELALLAQRLRDQLNDPALPPLADTPIGASIGIAYYPEDAYDSAGIIAAANVAMYAARRAGRNHVAFNALAA
jgi:diguanylate cyclase (GGDEF)-like protein